MEILMTVFTIILGSIVTFLVFFTLVVVYTSEDHPTEFLVQAIKSGRQALHNSATSDPTKISIFALCTGFLIFLVVHFSHSKVEQENREPVTIVSPKQSPSLELKRLYQETESLYDEYHKLSAFKEGWYESKNDAQHPIQDNSPKSFTDRYQLVKEWTFRDTELKEKGWCKVYYDKQTGKMMILSSNHGWREATKDWQ